MILTTTDKLENFEIEKYIGLVFAEQVNGINFMKDMGASIRNFIGGRSRGYEEELISTRNDCMDELVSRAENLGADAVIGIKFNVETLGADGSMVLMNVVGTAIKIKR